ncbi:MAG TPA: S1 family peptidase [Kofleriaceae bacterium]|nr:S1 family peptidase [Kofleriaceae bacterium]
MFHSDIRKSTLNDNRSGVAIRALVSGVAGATLALTGCASELDPGDVTEPAAEITLDHRAAAPPDWEAEGFSRERGISLAEARRRLAWQVRAPRLSDRAASDLGDRFGGVWIDVQDGDRIKVGIAGTAGLDKAAVVRRAADAVGLSEGYDFVEVRHSLATLERANAWLGAQIAKVNHGASATLTAGLRTDLNALQLEAPIDGALTDAQRDLVTAAQARFGDMIVVGTYRGRPTARGCSYPYCDAPLRGGIRITNSGQTCTGGFIARSKEDSVLYQFTAGHCADVASDDWETEFTNGTSHVIGAVWNWEFGNGGGDMAILRIANADGWDPKPWVYVTSGPDTTTNMTYEINSDDTSVVGMRICTTGGVYGASDCGYVTQIGMTTSYNGETLYNLGRGSYCGTGGDSGAPMYASHVAYGLQVGRFTECDSFYQGIQAAETAMNVNVLHAP